MGERSGKYEENGEGKRSLKGNGMREDREKRTRGKRFKIRERVRGDEGIENRVREV